MTTDYKNKAIQFFFEHAGYSYDPKTETPEQGKQRGAELLARAEREAASAGIRFEWRYDDDGCCCCCLEKGEAPHTDVWYCQAWSEDGLRCLASLSGICGPSDDYRRVVEAELAAEALSELEN